MPRLSSTYFYPDDTGKPIPDLPVYWENWYAAGGMYSTTSDLLMFANALFGGDRLIGVDARPRLRQPALCSGGHWQCNRHGRNKSESSHVHKTSWSLAPRYCKPGARSGS
jgi:hypothetical protein